MVATELGISATWLKSKWVDRRRLRWKSVDEPKHLRLFLAECILFFFNFHVGDKGW